MSVFGKKELLKFLEMAMNCKELGQYKYGIKGTDSFIMLTDVLHQTMDAIEKYMPDDESEFSLKDKDNYAVVKPFKYHNRDYIPNDVIQICDCKNKDSVTILHLRGELEMYKTTIDSNTLFDMYENAFIAYLKPKKGN